MVNGLPNFEPRGVPFTAWLYRIARNLIIKESQQASKQATVPLVYAEAVHQDGSKPALVVEQQLQMEQMLQGLENIDENQREVVILRFIVGMSLKETAVIAPKT